MAYEENFTKGDKNGKFDNDPIDIDVKEQPKSINLIQLFIPILKTSTKFIEVFAFVLSEFFSLSVVNHSSLNRVELWFNTTLLEKYCHHKRRV